MLTLAHLPISYACLNRKTRGLKWRKGKYKVRKKLALCEKFFEKTLDKSFQMCYNKGTKRKGDFKNG